MNEAEIILTEVLMVSGVLALSLIAARLIQKEIRENITSISKKVEVTEEIRRMEFVRDLLMFFSNSEASKTALSLLDTVRKDSASIPTLDIPPEAKNEIEGLYSSMKLSSISSMGLTRLKFASTLFVKLIVVYGIGIASSVLVFSVFSGLFNTLGLLKLAGTVFIVWALAFSLILVYLSLEIYLLSKKSASEDLSGLGFVTGEQSGIGK